MTADDPLDDLYADEDPYDRDRLANVIEEYVQVDPETGEPMQLSSFYNLD